MGKRKGKFFKELKKNINNYKFNKHHFYYTALIFIIVILSIFLFNNYNQCTVYEVNADTDNFDVQSGILVLTKDDRILKISNISYSGDVDIAMDMKIALYVSINDENYVINSFSSTSDEGFDLANYLEKISFDINENNTNVDIFNSTLKKNIVNNLYLKISGTLIDGTVIDKDIKLNVDALYRNTKLFY